MTMGSSADANQVNSTCHDKQIVRGECYCMVVHGNFWLLRKYLEGNCIPKERGIMLVLHQLWCCSCCVNIQAGLGFSICVCACLWAESVGTSGEKESVELQHLPRRSTWFTRLNIQIFCQSPKMAILKTVLVAYCWMTFLHWLLAATGLNLEHKLPLAFCFFCALCLSSFP